MTHATGLPFGQRGRAPEPWLGILSLILISFCCAPSLGLAESPAPPALDDPSLDKSIQVIATSFQTEKPDPIASLVPTDGKTYISLMSIGGGGGYYSRDQVYFIFSRVFAQHDTVKFSVHRQKREGSARDFVYCVGNWYYHRHDGVDGDSQIHFVLSMRKGAWSLVEIREAQ
jgi:hypothetical protein